MGWNLFSSLDIRDNSKVAYLKKKIKQSKYMSGNWFRLFRVVNPVELYHCLGHWLCKKLELRSVGLPLSKFGTDQLCWAEICLWNVCCIEVLNNTSYGLSPPWWIFISFLWPNGSLLLPVSSTFASIKLCQASWMWLDSCR